MSTNSREFLNDDEIDKVTALLAKIPSGSDLPIGIFKEFARLTTISTLEIVPIIPRRDNGASVLLGRRSVSDIWWPGQLHLPGGIIRSEGPRDYRCVGYDDEAQKIMKREFSSSVSLGKVTVFNTDIIDSIRGREHKAFAVGEVTLNCEIPQFQGAVVGVEEIINRSVDDLVEGHHEVVEEAISVWNAN